MLHDANQLVKNSLFLLHMNDESSESESKTQSCHRV